MDENIKVGIIGAGRMGKIHAGNIVYRIPNAQVKVISDINPEGKEEWASKLGIIEISNDYKKILADPEIKAIIICSSTDTHSRIIIEASEAGKHIFCEKPIDYDLSRIRKALEAVEKGGVKFQVGFNKRFDHNFMKLREVVRSGQIGDPHIIRITSRDPSPPPVEYLKVSGGLFLDMTIHDFDMALYQADSEVVEVYAVGANLVDPVFGEVGDIDTAVITLKFENGALCVIDNSRQAVYGYDQRVEVFGSKGSVSAENDTQANVIISTESGVKSEKPLYFFLERYIDAYTEEIKQFIDAVIYNRQTPVRGIDGLKPVVIALAAKRSFEENRPVKTSEIF